jgi:hypothetical protein
MRARAQLSVQAQAPSLAVSRALLQTTTTIAPMSARTVKRSSTTVTQTGITMSTRRSGRTYWSNGEYRG